MADLLEAAARMARSGSCRMTDDRFDHVIELIKEDIDFVVSKEKACSELGISRNTFSTYVAQGKLPKGRHDRGFHGLYWLSSELKKFAKKNIKG